MGCGGGGGGGGGAASKAAYQQVAAALRLSSPTPSASGVVDSGDIDRCFILQLRKKKN